MDESLTSSKIEHLIQSENCHSSLRLNIMFIRSCLSFTFRIRITLRCTTQHLVQFLSVLPLKNQIMLSNAQLIFSLEKNDFKRFQVCHRVKATIYNAAVLSVLMFWDQTAINHQLDSTIQTNRTITQFAINQTTYMPANIDP